LARGLLAIVDHREQQRRAAVVVERIDRGTRIKEKSDDFLLPRQAAPSRDRRRGSNV
jgi:hypothetical protein